MGEKKKEEKKAKGESNEMVKQMSGHGSFSHKGKSRSEGQRGAEKKTGR